jgi:NADPH:quinone reductase-like Zn-dependent oxidoreductase
MIVLAESAMKAVQFDRYGPPAVLACREVAKPACGLRELLVEVHAAGVNPKDCLVRKGKFRWFTGRRFPLGLGHDFAGRVAVVGRRARGFQVGDAVFGMTNGWQGRTYAAYAVVQPSETALKPSNLTFEQAAAVPLAAQTALQALRDIGGLAPGQRVMINGASGGVGTFAVQIARLLGAQVVAICSGRNAALVRGLGAERVIDYHREDFREDGEPLDIFFDVFGNQRFPDIRPLLTPQGRYIATVPGVAALKWALASRIRPGPRASLVVVKSRAGDLERLAAWIADGQLRAVVDRTFPLTAAEAAHAYIETKRARGKVVLQVPRA